MRMNFKYNEETGDIQEATLVLSWDEFHFIATSCEIFDKVLEVDFFVDTGPSPEDRKRMIQRFDDLDGDGEDASPIDAESKLKYEDLWNPDDEDRISRSEYLKSLARSTYEIDSWSDSDD